MATRKTQTVPVAKGKGNGAATKREGKKGVPRDFTPSEATLNLIKSKRESMVELAKNPPPDIDRFHNDD